MLTVVVDHRNVEMLFFDMPEDMKLMLQVPREEERKRTHEEMREKKRAKRHRQRARKTES